jgi:hypothetical protein
MKMRRGWTRPAHTACQKKKMIDVSHYLKTRT